MRSYKNDDDVVVVVGSDDDDDDTKKTKNGARSDSERVGEMETTVIVDVLRRAGCRVTVASCEDSVTCRMSRDVQITAGLHDGTFEDEKQDQN